MGSRQDAPAGVDVFVPKMGLHELMPPRMINRPTGSADYLLMHFHNECLVYIDKTLEHFDTNSCIVWEPGSHHYYGHPWNGWDHSWIHFQGPLLPRFLSEQAITLNRPFPVPDPYTTEKYLMAIHGEITTQMEPDQLILRNFLDNWMRELGRSLRRRPRKSVPENLLRVRSHMEIHFQNQMRLRTLAEMADLSVAQFSSQFRRYFGFSPIDYLVHLRVQHATFLLGDINMTVTQVAEAVGYNDLFYFSRLFKDHHGVSPRRYRNSIRGDGAAEVARDAGEEAQEPG